MTHRGWEPNAGAGCHFHAVSGHPLIKVRAAADHIGMPLRNTHSDWRPTESSWVPESHSHTGATFPETASRLAYLPPFSDHQHKPHCPACPTTHSAVVVTSDFAWSRRRILRASAYLAPKYAGPWHTGQNTKKGQNMLFRMTRTEKNLSNQNTSIFLLYQSGLK